MASKGLLIVVFLALALIVPVTIFLRAFRTVASGLDENAPSQEGGGTAAEGVPAAQTEEQDAET